MDIHVTQPGMLTWRDQAHRCALGYAGISVSKREGDGTTPSGCFVLRRVIYRSDRLEKPHTGLSLSAIKKTDGWCDEPNDPNYNRPVVLPYAGRHERLWRDDALYDLIVVLGFNDDPPISGAGSAVFLHIASPDFAPTEGCIALPGDILHKLLAACAPGDRLCVTQP